MSTNFPAALDTTTNLPNPTGDDDVENAVDELDHDYQHATANDAIRALEAKVGVTGSAVSTSLEYRVTDLTRTRLSAVATTASLAAAATSTSVPLAMALSYRVLTIKTSRPARVRLYTTAAAQTADLARAVGTDPASTAGVVLDFVTTTANAVYSLSPVVEGANLETSPVANIPMTVSNLDSVTGTVIVTATWLRTE